MTHNYFRARHGSPPLVLSSALTDEAQYWAERLLVTGAMEGLDNSRIGISVAVLDKAHISGIKVIEYCRTRVLGNCSSLLHWLTIGERAIVLAAQHLLSMEIQRKNKTA